MSLRRYALAALLVAAVAPAAWARGHLQVGSTKVELIAGARAGRLVLRNSGDAPVGAQVRVYAWSQEGGEDRLAETREVVLSPPIVRIEAGASQLVRLVRNGPAPAGRDQTYRIVVEELPLRPAAADVAVGFRMRFVLPLFLRAADARPAQLACQLQQPLPVLQCLNSGGRAIKLGRTRIVDGNGRAVELTQGLYGYVLPGASRQWPVTAAQLSGLRAPLTLETRTDNAVDQRLPLN